MWLLGDKDKTSSWGGTKVIGGMSFEFGRIGERAAPPTPYHQAILT
jgi:hypothetical protein